MNEVAALIAEAGKWVAVLSADDPVNAHLPWRLFMAAGWLTAAVMEAMPIPTPETTP